jgi:transposase
MKKTGRREFNVQFRREAVRLAESGTMPIAEVARQLGVHVETLRQWRRKARQQAEGEPAATVPSLEEENRRLRRENARLLEEREILTKATAFFAKDAR